MIDYRQLGEALRAAGCEVSAAECQGFLCGQLCGPGDPGDELWREFLDPRAAEDLPVEDCYEDVRLLFEEIREQMWSGDFSFALLLPEDDVRMEERVEAIAGWCRGFLCGFGLVEELPLRVLPDGVQEWLHDLEMIARAGVEQPDADDELALAQVAEHVRTGFLLTLEELRGPAGRDGSEVWH
ncbi:MAG: UPF0149 family protein [Gammaproteobacteria bacterium]|nr:UPF0149 family protein [Gammaproteobacteria bacterium]